MANKFGPLCGALLGAMLLLAACKVQSPAQRLGAAASSADSIVCYVVDGYPTLPSAQALDRYYLHNYALREKLPLSSVEMDSLRIALQTEGNFDSMTVKSCPMIAGIALDLWRKGKSQMTLVMSPAPCGKALLFERETTAEPISLDLTTGNTLEPLVFGQRP